MTDVLSASGLVATVPELKQVGNGISRLTFRLASQQRRYNRADGSWENGETNWYSVVAFRRLADNAASSIAKGDRVVVSGRLRTNEWDREGQRTVTVELLADSLGHDLTFGTSSFSRAVPGSGTTESSSAASRVGYPPAPSDAVAAQPAAAVDSDGWGVPVAQDGDLVSQAEGKSVEEKEAEGAFAATATPF